MATHVEINHDSSTTIGDHYSSVTDTDSAVTVSAGNALNSSVYGVGIDIELGLNEVRLEETFSATGTEFRWRMRFDLSLHTPAANGNGIFFGQISRVAGGSVASTRIATFAFRGDNSGGVEGDGGYYKDTSGIAQTMATVTLPPSSEFCVEVAIVGESFDGAADGTAEWWLNGVSQDLVTGIENFNRMGSGGVVTRLQFATISNGTGDVKYDEWIIDDSASADVGCPVIFSGYDLVLGGGQP